MSAPSLASLCLVRAILVAALSVAAACADQHDSRPTDEPLPDAALPDAALPDAALPDVTLDGGASAVDASVGAQLDASDGTRFDATLVLPPLDVPEGLCRSDLANEHIWQLTSHADRACLQTSDCVVLVPRISCGTECNPVPVSELGAMQFNAALSRLEQDLCSGPPDNRPCQYGDTAVCTLPPYQPRCHHGQCGQTPVGCPLDQTEQLEGEACSTPGRECYNPGFCPLGVRCSDEAQPGVYRWVLQILLC